jgi:hypothetical protein
MALTKTSFSMIQGASANVLDFGGDPTGVASSSAAINAAQAYLAGIGGGTLYFAPGEYKVTTPIVIQPGITYKGPMKAGISNYNPNRSRIFSSTGNIFVNSSSTITESCFRDLYIESEVGGGNIFDWSSSGIVAKIEISGCAFLQRNPAKYVINGTAAGGVFSIWMHDFEYQYDAANSVPAIYLRSPTINSIGIYDFWSHSSANTTSGTYSIWVESTGAGGATFNVTIKQGVFEIPGGGAIKLLSCTNFTVEDCSIYDLTVPPNNPMFFVGKGASSPASNFGSFRRLHSYVGTTTNPDLTIDLSVGAQTGFVVENCSLNWYDGVSANSNGVVFLSSDIFNFKNSSFTSLSGTFSRDLRFYTQSASGKVYDIWNGVPGNAEGYLNIFQNGAYVGAISPTGLLQWGGTRAAPAFYAQQAGFLNLKNAMYPGTPAGVDQASAGLFAGLGAPNNANGNNGDFYFRGDGSSGTSIYMKRSGSWVGIV